MSTREPSLSSWQNEAGCIEYNTIRYEMSYFCRYGEPAPGFVYCDTRSGGDSRPSGSESLLQHLTPSGGGVGRQGEWSGGVQWIHVWEHHPRLLHGTTQTNLRPGWCSDRPCKHAFIFDRKEKPYRVIHNQYGMYTIKVSIVCCYISLFPLIFFQCTGFCCCTVNPGLMIIIPAFRCWMNVLSAWKLQLIRG